MAPSSAQVRGNAPPISDPKMLLTFLRCKKSFSPMTPTTRWLPYKVERHRVLMPVLTWQLNGKASPRFAQRFDQLTEETYWDLILTALVGVEVSKSTKQCLPTRKQRANSWFSQATPHFCLQPPTAMSDGHDSTLGSLALDDLPQPAANCRHVKWA